MKNVNLLVRINILKLLLSNPFSTLKKVTLMGHFCIVQCNRKLVLKEKFAINLQMFRKSRSIFYKLKNVCNLCFSTISKYNILLVNRIAYINNDI